LCEELHIGRNNPVLLNTDQSRRENPGEADEKGGSKVALPVQPNEQEVSMNRRLRVAIFAGMALIAAGALGIHEARAGYVDIYGMYHPTCVWTIYGYWCD